MSVSSKFLAFILLSVFLSCKGQDNTKVVVSNNTNLAEVKTKKVLANSIAIPADSLPEFKIDIHAKGSQGNQISGTVITMLQDSKETLWFGTANGLCRYQDDELVYFNIIANDGSKIAVKTIKEDTQGNLWIGHTGGITKYDGTYFTNFSMKDGLVHDDVWSMEIDSKGTIWIGTVLGMSTFDGDTFSDFDFPEVKPDELRGVRSSKMVNCITEDSKGRIWFGTSGGAFVYDPSTALMTGGDSLTNISDKDGLCNNTVNGIKEDKNGNIWFATHHNGICKWNGKTFSHYGEDHGINGTEAGGFYEDTSGNFWFVIEHAGVYRFNPLEATPNFKNFDKKDGLNLGVYGFMEDTKGRFWFGGYGGLYRYDPSALLAPDGTSFVNITRDGPW